MGNLDPVELPFFADAPKIVRNAVLIAAPRSAVFDAIATDPAGWGNWFPGFTGDGHWETPAPHGVGSKRTVRAFRTTYRETILAWEAGERFTFRVDAANTRIFAALAEDYRLTDEGSGTLLTWTVAYRPALALRAAAPVAPLIFRSIAVRAAAGLTRVAGVS